LTEINVTRIGKWWNSASRFFWSGFGVLCIMGGVIQLIRDGSRVWGWMMISAGITIATIPLTTVRCPNYSSPNPFKQTWEAVYRHHQFTCYACDTQLRLPPWGHVLLNIVIYGYGFLTAASACNKYFLASMISAPDYLTVAGSFPFPWALTMLLIRFSRYEGQESG
jgi:hypothetical protein